MKTIKTIIFIFIFFFGVMVSILFAQEKYDTIKSSKVRMVPDISLILDFGAAYRNINNEKFESLEIPEFTHSHAEEGEEGHSHEGMNANRGFNFNYGELVMSAAVDPYFNLFSTFHLSEDSFEVEEGYINTTSLPAGVQLKAGKFLSNFGRINSQHPHSWSFNDMPLVYKAFFGEEGLLEKGAQLGWTLPTGFFMLLGGEILQGENEASFGYEGFSTIPLT